MSTTLERALIALAAASVEADDAAGFAERGEWSEAAFALYSARYLLRDALRDLAGVQDCGDPGLWLNAIAGAVHRRRGSVGMV